MLEMPLLLSGFLPAASRSDESRPEQLLTFPFSFSVEYEHFSPSLFDFSVDDEHEAGEVPGLHHGWVQYVIARGAGGGEQSQPAALGLSRLMNRF
jgi:hypothetical protein